MADVSGVERVEEAGAVRRTATRKKTARKATRKKHTAKKAASRKKVGNKRAVVKKAVSKKVSAKKQGGDVSPASPQSGHEGEKSEDARTWRGIRLNAPDNLSDDGLG